MSETLQLLVVPFIACLLLAGIHCYLGLHVLTRGVIFVDLALAQIAALGGAVGMLAGYELDSNACYLFSLAFTFIGAVIFASGRFREDKIPQEALIGITYAVSSAAAILILDRSPHGHEEIKTMLLGSILFVDWPLIVKTFLIYSAVAFIHFLFRKKFFLISNDIQKARQQKIRVWLWDLIFYITFGLIVTSSVRMAGVLLVFTFLVVPAVCALLFFKNTFSRLLFGWGIGLTGSTLGLSLSVLGDLPTGASIVTVFGGVLICCLIFHYVYTRNSQGEMVSN